MLWKIWEGGFQNVFSSRVVEGFAGRTNSKVESGCV